MSKRPCGNCVHWFRVEETDTGSCHAVPPYIVPSPKQNPLTREVIMGVVSVFPPLPFYSHCGRFKHYPVWIRIKIWWKILWMKKEETQEN